MQDDHAETLSISNRVRAMMDRNGVPKRSQATRLSELLEMSYSAASRKMNGKLTWEIGQLKKIAESFGESPSVLIDAGALEADESDSGGVPAVFMIAGTPVTCTAWIGDEIDREMAGTFVAHQTGNQWFIFMKKDVPDGRIYDVKLAELRPAQPDLRRPSVAVLDDDRKHHSADSLATYLNEHGFKADAYTKAGVLSEALRTSFYDAFVVDWILGPHETAEALIRAIRHETCQSKNAVIMILSGKLADGTASESDVTRVMTQYRCQFLEKPVRVAMLANNLANQFPGKLPS